MDSVEMDLKDRLRGCGLKSSGSTGTSTDRAL